MTVRPRFQHHGLILVRATTDPGDLDVPTDLDLADPEAVAGEGVAWLAKTWVRPDVRDAVRLANPVLAGRLDRLLTGTTQRPGKDARRGVESVASYLLRWQRRATPFGLFAGVTTARIGPAHAVVERRHRTVARVDAEWLTTVVGHLERHPQLRPQLHVVADNTAVVRDGRCITARRADLGGGTAVPLREASIRYTRPAQYALATAAAPIRVDALVADLTARFPSAAPQQIHTIIDTLIDQGFLITCLRPPMTVVDGLTYLIGRVTAAGGRQLPDVAGLLDRLDALQELIDQHNTTADPVTAAALRAAVADQTMRLPSTDHCTTVRHTLAVDTRLDADIRIPEPVLAEAAQAASVLLRVATKPFGTTAWQDYRVRFRARYGVGALVAVRDLLADSGLGYPTGYLGAPRAHPSWRTLTERDATMLALVQRAALDGRDEIVLTDADIEALTVGDPSEVVPPSRVELGVTLHAASADAVDRGDFLLHVTATPGAPTSMAGRFAPLLDVDEQLLLAASYGADAGDALVVQLSFPPRRPHNENVTRVPQLLPALIRLAEHPPGNAAEATTMTVSVDDLAVTTDGSQMFLVQRSTGRRVVPFIPHALDTVVQSPPLARFLAEVGDARTAVFGPLDVGAARTLPYLPRIRYRRTVLAAARWTLSSDALPPATNRWDTTLDDLRNRWRIPPQVVLCHGELRLPLNLDHRLDRALLRNRLAQHGRLELQEDLRSRGPDWLDRPVELLIPMTAIDPPARPVPPLAPPGRRELPGTGDVLQALLAGNPARFDEILTIHLPRFATSLDGMVQRWWIGRHRDLIRLDADQHLILTLRLTDPAHYGSVAAAAARLADDLHTRGLPGQLSLTPYHHQPGRYGEGPALAAAEHVFAADTACAITQLTVADRTGIPAQALAAASMVRIAAALDPADPTTGYRLLLACLPQQTGPLDRALRDHTLNLTDPTTLDGIVGASLAATWQFRDAALARYVHVLAGQRDPATVLPTLLHQHHIRALGVDPTFEQITNRLARAAARRCLALTGTR